MYKLNNELEVEGEGFRKIILLENVNGNIYSYVDRDGHKRFAYKLIGDKFYSFNNEYFQEVFIINNNGKEEITFREGGNELSLEEMLKSQLNGPGKFIYFKHPFNEVLSVGKKSELERLRRIDPYLEKICSEMNK